LGGLQRIICLIRRSSATTTTFATTTATTTCTSNTKAKTSIVYTDAARDEGVVAFDRQVVYRASAKLGLADNGAEVTVGINEAVVSAKRVNFDEGIELVENPVVRGGIKMLTAPKRVADDALTFVFVNLEDLGFVDIAGMVKAKNQIARLQFINAALAAGNRDERMANEAASTTATTRTLE
jgi:hypothetical protein